MINVKIIKGTLTITVDSEPFIYVQPDWFDLHDGLRLVREHHLDIPYADKFLERYYQLSLEGKADSPGGMEYRRMKRRWRKAGKPPVKKFLIG